MPRRLMVPRDCPHQTSSRRMTAALHRAVDGPSLEHFVVTQDYKLQEIKHSVFTDIGGPVKLRAGAPIPVISIVKSSMASHTISTHYNDNVISEVEIDFSRAEDFLQLETPIDARKDHNMLKIAYTIPKRTFMCQILRKFPVNKKRLAFIQRRPPANKVPEVGNHIVREGKEVSITCQVCGQRFNRQYQFQRHILIHPDPDNKKFLCQICGKRFNRADHLNRHVLLHGDISIQKCVLCGEEFDRASHLDRHRRKHHPPAGQQPSQTPPLTPQLKSPPANVVIATSPGDFDGIGFVTDDVSTPGTGTNLHLLAAVATPEGSGLLEQAPHHPSDVYQPLSNIDFGPPTTEVEPDRPFPCEVCGRKFIRATHLRRHMRIHTGEKPFACHICGRRYARGDYLRAHIFAHRRDRMHKCKHCGEVFQDLTRFADHCRLVHKDLDDEHGNPRPPPDNSPPPSLCPVLENTLIAESAESITVVQSIPMWERNVRGGPIPVTLVDYSEQDRQEMIFNNYHGNALHTPTQTHELHLTHLPSEAPHELIRNGQLGMLDNGNDVTILGEAPPRSRKPPQGLDYMDPVAQYILNNGNIGSFPSPHPTPVLGQGYPQSAS